MDEYQLRFQSHGYGRLQLNFYIKNPAPPPHAYERLNNHTYLKKIRLNLYFSNELTSSSIEGELILVVL